MLGRGAVRGTEVHFGEVFPSDKWASVVGKTGLVFAVRVDFRVASWARAVVASWGGFVGAVDEASMISCAVGKLLTVSDAVDVTFESEGQRPSVGT